MGIAVLQAVVAAEVAGEDVVVAACETEDWAGAGTTATKREEQSVVA